MYSGSATIPLYAYYTALAFKAGVAVPPLFYLDDESYFYSFFCTEEIKDAMKAEQFLGFDFYALADYAQTSVEQKRRFERSA